MMQRTYVLQAEKGIFYPLNNIFYAMGLQGTVIRSIFQTATSFGAAFDTLCQMCDIRQNEINDSEKMVEWEKAALIWVPLLKLTNDSLIGLHMGMGIERPLQGMVGFLIQSSRDLNHGLQTLCKYGSLISPMITYRYLEEDGVILEIEQNKMWLMKYPEAARQANDFLIAQLINSIAFLTGKRVIPKTVEIAFERRAIDEYRTFFGCDVLFNKQVNRIVLNKKDASIPFITSDESMFERFKSILDEKQALLADSSTIGNLKQVLFMQFKGRIPSIEEAATALQMTPRSLQRKLLEEKTTFRQVAAVIRKDIALQLMQNPGIKISEVSDILGYSDPTAFRKAFKSWTHTAPTRIRGRANS